MRRLPVIQPEDAAPEAAPAAAPGAPRARYRVEGMDCAACARTVERATAALPGVQRAEVSFAAAVLDVWGEATEEQVAAAVARAGYRARPYRHPGAGRRRRLLARRDRRTLSTAASLVLLAVAVGFDLAAPSERIADGAYAAAMLVGGWPIAISAATAVRRRTLDMNVLMTLAALGALAIGEWAEAAWVLVLFALGTTLEALALDQTRGAVAALAELVPLQARVAEDGAERLVDVEHVPAGSVVVVHPGERIPLDGVVEAGASAVDEAPVTGESVPVDKAAGARVFAGSLNQHGVLRVRTSEEAAGSTLSRMVELVEQAQATRAPSERFVDRFARIYTPLVVAAALLVAVVPVVLGADASTWFYRALALLIVACPCALVISVPVAVVSALGAAARGGVLVKGGQALEDLARVRTVCIDKTGTLTQGLPVVTEVRALAGGDELEALRLMAAVERRSEHPLAAAIRRAAAERGVAVSEPARFLALPGRGVEALVDGRALWAGGPRLVAERAGAGAEPVVAELERDGQTVLALGEGDRVLVLFGIADRPRPEAAQAVARLRRDGREVRMLTGDSGAVAQRVARVVGIDAYDAGLLPEDKLRLVGEARARGLVAMVGDGVNDAPALAAADVGVAMGAAGSAVALEAADVALMSDDLRRLPDALRLAGRARRTMRQNVVASLAVKGAFVALAPLGLVSLWLAVAADMGMSLLVTANALRLLRGFGQR